VEDVAQREQEQVHVTCWGVGTEHEVDVMREWLGVEVSNRPVRGSVSLESCQRGGLLAEAKRAEMFGNEVQASEVKGLEGREDGRCPQPSKRGHGKLQRAEANHIAQAHEAGGVIDEGHPIAGTADA
jgi:hypothetical protein